MQRKKPGKKEGFQGQKLIVLPKKIDSDFLMKDAITRQIYITDIGYYPKAYQHYMERPGGIKQHIIIYCVEGRGWVTVNKKKMDISPSHFIVIPANTPHKYGAVETDPWTIYWVHFKGDIATYVVDLITNNSQNYLPYLSYNENRIKLFEEICFNLEKGYSADNLRYVNMIFYHFLSSLLYEEKYNQAEKSPTKDPIALTIEMMQKKINTIITLNDFAAFANLSVSHFSTMFRVRTGFSPVEYFNHLKIQHSCQSLVFTAKPIKEIADDLGFYDQYYFSRTFSRFMGISPSEYRNRNKAATV
jgi:AraC family transcriptional regulator, arabinose operon regulatory protein